MLPPCTIPTVLFGNSSARRITGPLGRLLSQHYVCIPTNANDTQRDDIDANHASELYPTLQFLSHNHVTLMGSLCSYLGRPKVIADALSTIDEDGSSVASSFSRTLSMVSVNSGWTTDEPIDEYYINLMADYYGPQWRDVCRNTRFGTSS